MQTTVVLTRGHISIRRGRFTRQYDPTWHSFNRLCNVLNHGAADCQYTQRSTIYNWHGSSTLTRDQRKLFTMFRACELGCKQYSDNYRLGYLQGVENACLQVGIHKLLLHPDMYSYGE